MKSIGLCMIVKDEAPIMRRCLAAARPIVDCALIVDTGSSDDTIAATRAAMAELGLPGEAIERPWRDFAHNRSEALAALRSRRPDVDYALMIDADDRVELSSGFDAAALKQRLRTDVYNVSTRMNDVSYLRPQLISNRKDFFFKGVLHEFLECAEPFEQARVEDFWVVSVQDSARNRLADKYLRDAAVLEAALARETEPAMRARYSFYLAQSWRDAGERTKSIAAYLARADMGGWSEEAFCSLYYAAQQMAADGRGLDEVVATYERAWHAAPHRAEALHGAARLCRLNEQFQRGFEIAQRGVDLEPPPNGLFVERWIYDYGLRDELAVNAYWVGEHRACLDACITLLENPALAVTDRPRVAANARFALGQLLPSS